MRTRAKTRSDGFRGTPRFEVLGQLGAGGMGIVYRAIDRERNVQVALKTLTNVTAAAIFRFKQEFRALADVAHPNLVSLHELFCEDGRWFFTMELLDGVDLLTHVCGRPLGDDATHEPSTQHDTVADRFSATLDLDAVTMDDAVVYGPPLIARLREALAQLVAGVMALHDSGHLHHDLKPSNVMVTTRGRVAVLDFGVIAQVGIQPGGDREGTAIEAAGTPAYMAPEQSTLAPATPASDWYAVGVVLYQALAGRLPFTGTAQRILWDKAQSQPAPVRLSRPDVPEDLDRLCQDLLHPVADKRPTGAEVLRRLGLPTGGDRRRATPRAAVAADDGTLVGRDDHLAELHAAFGRARGGASATVLLHGVSGMGKSALVRAFLDEVRREPATLVLAGRCYERESVPYKAVDTVVDALCQHLIALPAAERAGLIPTDAALLATLFPVLRRIEALAGEVDPELARRPHRLRRRAFAALRALLANVAARRPLVVFIDDLQWGDADSARLLAAVMRSPGAPAMLLLGCYRSDEAHRSALLVELLKDDATAGAIHRSVDALAPAQAHAVATALLVAAHGDGELAGAVARESGGNPFFLHELVRYLTDPGRVDAAIPSLDAVICARVDRLGDAARRLVEVLAVAGRPLEQRVAQSAARVAETDWPALVQQVGTARVVRVSGRRGDDLIECYHDRIRETLVARLPAAEVARQHHALGHALLDTYRRDPETIAQHFEAAGDLALAARYSLQAADLAESALAFDRAAALYRRALELRTPAAVDELAIRLRLAAALVNAGRGAEAARIYLDAAATTSGEQALEMRRLAAEQLLRSGYLDEGITVLREVLAAVGMSLPRSARRSVPSLLWRRLRLRLRGLEPGRPAHVSAAHLARLEICRTATVGLALFDPVRAATFSTRHLHLALDAGDPYRISYALAAEAVYVASARNPTRANLLLAKSSEIAQRLGHPALHGVIGMIRAIMAHERGDYRASFEACERTEGILREQVTGAAWELRTLQMYSVHNLFLLGAYRESIARAEVYIADARERGDLYAIMNLRPIAAASIPILFRDDPDAAHAELDRVERDLPGSGFYVQHVFVLYGRSLVDLHAGEYERGYRRLVEARKGLAASLLGQDRSVRMFSTYLTAGTALALATRQPRGAARLVRVGERGARVLERDGAPTFVAMAHVLRGAAALARGHLEASVQHLEVAATGFEAHGMQAFAAAARRRLGQVVGGDRGAQLIAAADAFARDQTISDPVKSARTVAPGFPDS